MISSLPGSYLGYGQSRATMLGRLALSAVLVTLILAGCSERPPEPLSSPRPEQRGPALSPRAVVQAFMAELRTVNVAPRDSLPEPLRDRSALPRHLRDRWMMPVDFEFQEHLDRIMEDLVDRYLDIGQLLTTVEAADMAQEATMAVVALRLVDNTNQQINIIPVFLTQWQISVSPDQTRTEWRILPARVDDPGRPAPIPDGLFLSPFSGTDPQMLDLTEDEEEILERLRQRFQEMQEKLI